MIPKFRAWDVRRRIMFMVTGMSFKTIGDVGDVYKVWGRKVDPVPVNRSRCFLMPFTGAKDMNDTDIYEGDIVRKEECSPDDMAFGYYGSVGVVKYDVNVTGFIIDGDGAFANSSSTAYSFNRLEVVGNVYENIDMVMQ